MACKHLYNGKWYTRKQLTKVLSNLPEFRTIDQSKVTKPLDSKIFNLVNKKKFSTKIEGFNASEVKAFTESVVFLIARNSGIEDFNDVNTLNIDRAKLIGNLVWFGKNYTKTLPEYATKIKGVIQNIDKFIENAKQSISKYGLETTEEGDEDSTQSNNSVVEDKASYEKNSKDSASANTKLLIATLPNIRIGEQEFFLEDNSNVSIEHVKTKYELNPLTGLPTLVNYDDTYNFLLSTLSNNVTNFDDTSNDTVFQNMLESIKELSEFKPALAVLYNKLSDPNYPEFKKTQFFRAMSLAKMNYVKTVIDSVDDNFRVRFIRKEESTKDKQIINEWISNLNNSDLIVSGRVGTKEIIGLDSLKVDRLAQQYKDLAKRGFELKPYTANNVVLSIKRDLRLLLNGVGISVSSTGLDYAIYSLSKANSEKPNQSLTRIINKLGYLFNEKTESSLTNIVAKQDQVKRLKIQNKPYEEQLSKIYDEKSKTVIVNYATEPIIEFLANSQSLFESTSGENTVRGPGNNLYYGYAQHTYLDRFVTNINNLNYSNYKDSFVYKLSQSTYNQNSLWFKEIFNKIENGNFKKLKVVTHNGFREDVSDDVGDAFQDLQLPDELVDRLHSTLNGQFTLLTASDKKSMFRIEGLDIFKAHDESGVSDRFIRLLSDYFYDEYSRMGDTHNISYGNIANYESNRKHSFLFPELGRDSKNPSNLNTLLYDSKGVPILDKNEVYNTIGEYIKEKFNALLVKENNLLLANNVYNNINSDTLAKYEGSLNNILIDYVANNIISAVESTKLFTGDPAFYKVKAGDAMSEVIKRFPEVMATGSDLRLITKPTFNVAIANDLELDYSEELYTELKKLVPNEQALSIAASYKKTNVGDAQAYITFERWRDLQIMLGNWKKGDDIWFDVLNNPKSTTKQVKEASNLISNKLFTQPLKGQAYDVSLENGIARPIYLKYSQLPLIPTLIKGTDLTKILIKMKESGTDELVFISGIKTGAKDVTSIADDKGVISDDFTLTPFKVRNTNWKLQVDLTSKYKKNETLMASQPKINIKANLELDRVYSNGKTGKEIIDQLNLAENNLIDRGVEVFRDLIGVDENNQIINDDYLYSQLKQEFIDRAVPQNIIDMLDQKYPLSLIVQDKDKVQNILSSMLKKRVVTWNMPGAAFIQASSVGFSKYDSNIDSSVIWLKDEPGLKQMTLDENDNIVSAEVLLPYNIISKIPGIDKMSNSQIKSILNSNPEILELIGYRIPNQGLSSIDSLKVVGILPKHSGDTIVVYPQITVKTGSDFDIDKMYVVQPNVKWDGTKLIKVDRLDDTNSTPIQRYNAYTNERLGKFASSIYSTISHLSKESKDKIKLIKRLEDEIAIAEDYIINDTKLDQAVFNLIDGLFGLSIKNIDDLLTADLKIVEIKSDIINNDEDIFLLETKLSELKNELITLDQFNNLPNTNQQTTKVLQNEYFEQFKSILNLKENFVQINTSLDSAELKEDISNLLPETALDALDFYSPSKQIEYRRENAGGKFDVGGAANHTKDHTSAQQAGLFINDNLLGLGDGIITRYDLLVDPNGNYIINNLSAMLSAFVDIAKDPYISRANFNTKTNNVAYLLFRSGKVSNKFIIRFMASKILRDYTQFISTYEARTSQKIQKGKKTLNTLDAFLTQYGTSKEDIIKNLPNITDLSIDQLETAVDSITPDSLNILGSFIYLQDYAKALNNSVIASKSDTTGNGRDVIEAMVNINKIQQVLNEGIVGNFSNKFEGTPLANYLSNTSEFILDITKDVFIESTPQYISTINEVSKYLKNSYPLTNYDTAKDISNSLYSYLLGTNISFFSSINTADLVKGPNSLNKRLYNYKTGDSPLKSNLLIQSLKTALVNGNSLIDFNNVKKLSPIEQELLTESWRELLESNVDSVAKFGEDLIRYAFINSGFNPTIKAFYKLIPNEYLAKLGIVSEFRNLQNNLINGSVDTSGFIDFFFRSNINSKYVPKVSNKIIEGKLILSSIEDSDKIIGKDIYDEFVMPLYIKKDVKSTVFKFGDLQDITETKIFKQIGKSESKYVYKEVPNILFNSRGFKLYDFNSKVPNLDSLGLTSPQPQIKNFSFVRDNSKFVTQIPTVESQTTEEINSEEYNKLIEQGYTPEAANHKLKNNC